MKGWTIILIIVILAGVILLFMSMTRKKPSSIQSNNNNRFITEINPDMVLRLGDQGEIVRLMQKALNNKLIEFKMNVISETGKFDSATELAIQKLTQGLLSSSQNNITLNNINFRTNW